jgi:peptidoglycan/xylan/chitin deacetylase (PgdA/CDA1 family)
LPSPIPPTWTTSPLPSSTKPATVTQTSPLTDTFTPIPSETPLPTFTPTISPEPQWSFQGPGDINVPILLYHHIGISPSNSEYYISPAVFEQQMRLLYEWGYQTISVELMVKAIKEGAELPTKPIILTFDDGSESVYTTALPIMQKYGFTGTAYLVYNYIGASQYMDVKEARELYAAGWEIGSHSISHVDLTTHPGRQEEEIVESRRKLQILLDVPILTYAYPYGTYDEDSVPFAIYAGYIGAVGLGVDTHQGKNNLYYLYRRDIKSSHDMLRFASFLPWQGNMSNLPVPTIIQ